MTGYTSFEWTALGIWFVVITVLVYGIIAIHDIPASIARKRNHPQADAIEAAGWVSLFLMHALWPFLWIWAMTYKPEDENKKDTKLKTMEDKLEHVQARLAILEEKEA